MRNKSLILESLPKQAFSPCLSNTYLWRGFFVLVLCGSWMSATAWAEPEFSFQSLDEQTATEELYPNLGDTLNDEVAPKSPDEMDLPKLVLPSSNSSLYDSSSPALTPVQKSVMDIFSSTLTEQDSRSFRFSPGGGGALVEQMDYNRYEMPKNDYSMNPNPPPLE